MPAPWADLADDVLESLARLVETADPSDRRLRMCVLNATKLFAVAAGSEIPYTHAHAVFILDYGVFGYEVIAHLYGHGDEPEASRVHKANVSLLHEARELIKGPVSENRTRLHEVLDGMKLDSPALDLLKDRLEDVTQGNLDWSMFCAQAVAHLDEMGAVLDATAPPTPPWEV